MKKINDYVKQGEVILSGAIMRDEEVKNLLAAKGRVLGEVWYEAHIEVPFQYYEEKETGKSQTVSYVAVFKSHDSLRTFFL